MAFKRSFNKEEIAQAREPKRESKFNSFLRGYQTTKALGNDIFGEQIEAKKAEKKYKRDQTLYEELENSGKYEVAQVTIDKNGYPKKVYKVKPTMEEKEAEQLKLEKMRADTKYSNERADAYKEFKDSQIAKNKATANKKGKDQSFDLKEVQSQAKYIRDQGLDQKSYGELLVSQVNSGKIKPDEAKKLMRELKKLNAFSN